MNTKLLVWIGMTLGFFLYHWMHDSAFGTAVEHSYYVGMGLATLAFMEWLG
jgi:hypothetical protein